MKEIAFYHHSKVYFDIVQIGAGGNGGYITQRLSKLLSSIHRLNDGKTKFSYQIIDQDIVEDSNLQRQPFLPKDIGKNKAQVLASRYGKAYQIPVFHREQFVESVEELENSFASNHDELTTLLEAQEFHVYKILIGAVDNHASRKIMHEYFSKNGNIVYIDCGVDGVLAEGTDEEKAKSGYSGHCVCGVRIKDVELGSVCDVYPDILEDQESLLPTQSCGQRVVYQPQRMQANEFAALITMGYLNQIIAERKLYHWYTNFNSLLHSSRPVLIP